MAEHGALPLIILSEKFASLPGIGMKMAERIAYHIMHMEETDVEEFAQAILDARKRVHRCKYCQNLTEREVCPICSDTDRDKGIVCVVEAPRDVKAFERTREYGGVYHVLHGLISPLDNVKPDDLCIKELLEKISAGEVREVIMATNPTVEGDVTAMYIAKILKPMGVKVTRLALGLPIGGILEYADEVTLYKALENRSDM